MVIVFGKIEQGAVFALRLFEEVQNAPWESFGFDIKPGIRIGMHTGPVYRRRDAILGRANFFGRHVNMAARIKPVTEVNCVCASEQFAATLAIDPNQRFVCEYLGMTELPKSAGAIPLYQFRRRSWARFSPRRRTGRMQAAGGRACTRFPPRPQRRGTAVDR